MSKRTTVSYREAGVDIDAGDAFVDRIAPMIQKTSRPEVMSSLGGYAGLFKLNITKYKKPVLVSSTDGVGTKLRLAIDLKKYDTIGIDLVAMCVNDLLCCGAEPLFFLDYFATGKLLPEVGPEILKGITDALAPISCSLLGGETAEMPGLYQKDDFDLAGFVVGVVDEDKIIDGKNVKVGDKIIGLPSSGPHSNGYSLIRKVLEENGIHPASDTCGFLHPVGYELLKPTLIYVNPVMKLLESHSIKAISHITGGGLVENVPRVLPTTVSAQFQKSLIPTQSIFTLIQELGPVDEDEMWRVFNMGLGMVVVVDPSEEKDVLSLLEKEGFPSRTVGEMIPRGNDGGVVLV